MSKIVMCFFPLKATPEIRQLAQPALYRKVKVRDTLELGVEASCNPGPLDYCWFHNQQPLPETNSSHLVLRNITTTQEGRGH